MNGRKAWYKRYVDDTFVAGMTFQTNPVTGEIWFESDKSLEAGGIADWIPTDRITYKDPTGGEDA